MKTKMRGFVALLMAAMIMAGMIPTRSEAKKVTYYRTKKVFLQTKETKIVKTTKKIKKVVGVNQTLKGVAKGKKISSKKIKFTPGKASGNTGLDEEDIMVTYTNGKKQKFIVKTVNPYLEKIAKKLRPLVKNPDEGLRIIAREYEQCYQTGKKDYFALPVIPPKITPASIRHNAPAIILNFLNNSFIFMPPYIFHKPP